MEETPAADAELPALLAQVRALLDRYQRVRADQVATAALALEPAAEPLQRLTLHELCAEAAFQRNDYLRALRHAGEARSLAVQLGDGTREALAQAWAGAALAQLSRYTEALEHLHPAIDALRSSSQEALASRALNYLALVHEELGDTAQAVTTYERSAAMARVAGDADMLGRALSNLGETYVSLHQPEQARWILLRALEVVVPRGDLVHVAWCRLSLAQLELEAGHEELGLDLLEQALTPAEQSGSSRTLAEVLIVLGPLRARRGERELALRLLQRALAIFEELGLRRELFRTHLALSEALERLGDYREALRHHQAYARLRAVVIDEVARAQLASLRERNELERARAQAEIERLRNVELAEANARLLQQQRELVELSRRDPLTGLLNRRHLDERLAEEFDRARRYGSPLSVAMADLDHFKAINDANSHAAGDEVLRRVADLFVELVRKVDLVARYGGEELVVVFPETTPAQALVACEKLRAAVEAAPWEAVAQGLRVTVSLGVAGGTDYPSWERLLSAADARLYEAKRQGRNRVVAPEPPPT